MRLLSPLTLATLALPFLGPLPALAEPDQVLDLPAGQVAIRPNPALDPELIAVANGKEIGLASAYPPEVITKHGDSVLLQVYSGGTACPTQYVWMTLDAKGLRATPAFGTCAEGVELHDTDGFPAAVMPGIGAVLGTFRYDFDGTQVVETPVKVESTGKAAKPSDWEGASAYDVLSDPAMQAEFGKIMSEAQIGELRQAVALTSPQDELRRNGEWIIGGGCRPELCDVESGQIAISVADWHVLGVFRDVKGPHYYGAEASEVFADGAESEVDLQGYWAVVAINGKQVWEMVDDERNGPSVEFDENGKASGQSFCNRWTGKAETSRNSISISGIAMTRMACPHQAAEAELMGVLEHLHSWAATDDGLELRTEDGHTILMVRPG
ncbi:META domain-containing protein [Paracoccus aminophilus]|uniref:Heat shock protein HslJ n=1 Tax=Paracoccus aminophilus JCM 7686 TaxID=1367847 RepID=S5Y104_PARAH|nr:META domain-containing protein [Paracoccus aminophilus]AGT11177.1 heat shock protein HslJ [Paracoccus aminophilus JCM 7686]